MNLDKLYSIREKIPKNIRRLLPKVLRRLINKKFFKYYFLRTDLKNLPNINYPEKADLEYQKELIEKFKKSQSQSSSMTCPHLMELLLMKFESYQNFNFLDIGGEKIDFYLSLKKNFKNAKYFLYNQKSMIDPFYKIQKEFKYDDFNIIDNLEDIFHNNYDFVNFGSCIQYFDNYQEVLENITNNSKHIFFSGTHLYDTFNDDQIKNIIVKQVNVLPQVNYLFFFNRKIFFKIFEEKGYNFVFESKNLTDKINYDNFNYYLKNIQYSDFLFSKNFDS